jgi:hypothetical protein
MSSSESPNDLLLALNARISAEGDGGVALKDLDLMRTLNFGACEEDSLVEMLMASRDNLGPIHAASVFEQVCENESVGEALRKFKKFHREFESIADWANDLAHAESETPEEGPGRTRDHLPNEIDLVIKLFDLSDKLDETLNKAFHPEKAAEPSSRSESTSLFWKARTRSGSDATLGREAEGPLRDIGYDVFK